MFGAPPSFRFDWGLGLILSGFYDSEFRFQIDILLLGLSNRRRALLSMLVSGYVSRVRLGCVSGYVSRRVLVVAGVAVAVAVAEEEVVVVAGVAGVAGVGVGKGIRIRIGIRLHLYCYEDVILKKC